MYGPVDYIVVGFKGNNFDGSIMDELTKAVENGIIRVIDLLFVMKDAEGNVAGAEYVDQSADLQAGFQKLGLDSTTPILSEDDMLKIGESMGNETAAGILVIEHLWAKGLKKAIIEADGFLIADGRIHPEAVTAAYEEVESEMTETKGEKANVR